MTTSIPGAMTSPEVARYAARTRRNAPPVSENLMRVAVAFGSVPVRPRAVARMRAVPTPVRDVKSSMRMTLMKRE